MVREPIEMVTIAPPTALGAGLAFKIVPTVPREAKRGYVGVTRRNEVTLRSSHEFLAIEVLGFLIILLVLSYFLDRRYTHIDRRIKKIDAKKNYSDN